MKTIRILHRYIGFFLVGIMVLYAFTGIVLTYRNTSFLKQSKHIEKQLTPDLTVPELSEQLHLHHFKAEKEDETTIYFREGSYNKTTGDAVYTVTSYPPFISKLISIHVTASGSGMSVLTTIFGIGLLFLAISSFWMFKPKTKMFKKGIVIILAGIIFAIVITLIS